LAALQRKIGIIGAGRIGATTALYNKDLTVREARKLVG
jgi:hypothetical protein